MLILSRKKGQALQIGDHIEIKIVSSSKGYAKIGIEAPKSLLILRKELITQIKDENLHSTVQGDVELEILSEKLKQ